MLTCVQLLASPSRYCTVQADLSKAKAQLAQAAQAREQVSPWHRHPRPFPFNSHAIPQALQDDYAALSQHDRQEVLRLQQVVRACEQNLATKDDVIANLTTGMEALHNKVQMQRQFCAWQVQLSNRRREAFASTMADKYFRQRETIKAFRAWRSVIENKWQARVERACQVRVGRQCRKRRCRDSYVLHRPVRKRFAMSSAWTTSGSCKRY